MTQETSLARGTLAMVVGNAVDAGAAVQARVLRAVVHILLALGPGVAIDTNAGVPALVVSASCTVLADVRVHFALVDILGAVLACVLSGAVAGVGGDAVHAPAAILTQVIAAVIDVHLAPVTLEACRIKAV